MRKYLSENIALRKFDIKDVSRQTAHIDCLTFFKLVPGADEPLAHVLNRADMKIDSSAHDSSSEALHSVAQINMAQVHSDPRTSIKRFIMTVSSSS